MPIVPGSYNQLNDKSLCPLSTQSRHKRLRSAFDPLQTLAAKLLFADGPKHDRIDEHGRLTLCGGVPSIDGSARCRTSAHCERGLRTGQNSRLSSRAFPCIDSCVLRHNPGRRQPKRLLCPRASQQPALRWNMQHEHGLVCRREKNGRVLEWDVAEMKLGQPIKPHR
jgi:hypothetical protein